MDSTVQDPEVNRDRPIAYGVYSVEDDDWKYFDNPCQQDGIPAHAMAQEKKWIAFADYDGYLRVYDWDADRVIYQVPFGIPGQSVASMRFCMGDTVILVEEISGALTLADVKTGTVLGEYHADYETKTDLFVTEDPERNLLYIGDVCGSMTGLCIETAEWTLLHEIPGLVGTLSQSEKLLQLDRTDNRISVTSVQDLSDMVSLGESFLAQ